jgi:hypothetical protein
MLAGSVSPIDVVVTEETGAQTIFHEATPRRLAYYGFASTDGISRIDFDFPGLRKMNWSFDNVSRSSIVPEPASVILLGSAMFGMLVIRKRAG